MEQRDLTKVAKFSAFLGFPVDEIEGLFAGATIQNLKHRECAYVAGDTAQSFALLLEGALKLVKSLPSGEDVILSFVTPGEFVALLLMSREISTYPVSVISMGESRVIKIPKRTYAEVWTKNPTMIQRVNNLIFARVAELQQNKLMEKASLPQRIARQLVSLVERFGNGNGTNLPMPLTRQEIADAVGASVESVIRVMSQWSQQGVLHTEDQRIEVNRMDILEQIMRGQD